MYQKAIVLPADVNIPLIHNKLIDRVEVGSQEVMDGQRKQKICIIWKLRANVIENAPHQPKWADVEKPSFFQKTFIPLVSEIFHFPFPKALRNSEVISDYNYRKIMQTFR